MVRDIIMRIWLISDTHFYHKSIIKYCHRPEDYSERLQKGFTLINKEDDILIHLGDVSLGHDEEAHEKYIIPIKCRKKWLIRGNHDRHSDGWYLRHGWDFVSMTMCNTYFGKRILFSHRPLSVPEGTINVHGHLHNLERKILESYPDEFLGQQDRHILVSPEMTDYKPVLLDTLIKINNLSLCKICDV